MTGLATLLNIIPGLGLGDLINVLLENALPLGSLIPIGYVSPRIADCTVKNGKVSVENGASVPPRAVEAGYVPAALRGSIVDTRTVVPTAFSFIFTNIPQSY